MGRRLVPMYLSAPQGKISFSRLAAAAMMPWFVQTLCFNLVGANSRETRAAAHCPLYYDLFAYESYLASGGLHLSDRLTKPDTCAGGRAPSSPMIFHIPSSFFLLRYLFLSCSLLSSFSSRCCCYGPHSFLKIWGLSQYTSKGSIVFANNGRCYRAHDVG